MRYSSKSKISMVHIFADERDDGYYPKLIDQVLCDIPFKTEGGTLGTGPPSVQPQLFFAVAHLPYANF